MCICLPYPLETIASTTEMSNNRFFGNSRTSISSLVYLLINYSFVTMSPFSFILLIDKFMEVNYQSAMTYRYIYIHIYLTIVESLFEDIILTTNGIAVIPPRKIFGLYDNIDSRSRVALPYRDLICVCVPPMVSDRITIYNFILFCNVYRIYLGQTSDAWIINRARMVEAMLYARMANDGKSREWRGKIFLLAFW